MLASQRAAGRPVLGRALLLAAIALSRLPLSGGLENGAARRPPMGWLAWQRFRCYSDCAADPENCLSEKLIKMVADRLVSDGYRDAGYTQGC